MIVCTVCKEPKLNDAFSPKRCQCKVCRDKMQRERAKKIVVPTAVTGWPWKYNGMVYSGDMLSSTPEDSNIFESAPISSSES